MLVAEKLLDAARDESGLQDYGDLSFTEGLGILVKSINAEAGLTPKYEAALKKEIVRVLVNRLRMQKDVSEHPEILDEVVQPPVFITSLPRTGSTKLHRLLGATGDFNAIPYWMSYNFAPLPGSNGDGADPRIGAAYEYLEYLYREAPLFHQAHPMYAEETEEDLSLLDAGFNSLYRWAALLDVPTYIGWVLSGDGLSGFRYLRTMLQYLQWQHYRGNGRRWLGKTPSLFGFEAGYAQVFQGTDFIVTHRDPKNCWPSVGTLFCGVRGMYSDRDFTDVACETMLANFSMAQHAHLAWRDSYPADKVFDARFGDIVGDEITLLRRIYDWLGMTFTADSERNVNSWLEMDERRGHIPNAATLADYGYTPERVDEGLAPYIERYREFL